VKLDALIDCGNTYSYSPASQAYITTRSRASGRYFSGHPFVETDQRAIIETSGHSCVKLNSGSAPGRGNAARSTSSG